MTYPKDLYNEMQALSILPIAEIWQRWDAIANRVIPSGYDLRDAVEDGFYPEESNPTANAISNRLDYLSDRLDTWRCYMLDYEIREFLGLPQRG